MTWPVSSYFYDIYRFSRFPGRVAILCERSMWPVRLPYFYHIKMVHDAFKIFCFVFVTVPNMYKEVYECHSVLTRSAVAVSAMTMSTFESLGVWDTFWIFTLTRFYCLNYWLEKSMLQRVQFCQKIMQLFDAEHSTPHEIIFSDEAHLCSFRFHFGQFCVCSWHEILR